MKKLILASASPRRKQILSDLDLEFEIIKSPFVENFDHEHFSYEEIERLAFGKARAVADMLDNSLDALVISADTVVVLENKVLGKPVDFYDAKKMLSFLSNKKHFVVTSICIIDNLTNQAKLSSTTSHVHFNNLTDNMIENYINDFKPFDKAGSYGIQELPSGFVKSIDGSFENIIGLCPNALTTLLREF